MSTANRANALESGPFVAGFVCLIGYCKQVDSLATATYQGSDTE